ncbi:MAG: hypothetical protein ACPLYD_16395, partial [Anaerolineae bacterium]
NTVEKHVGRILEKLGVRCRAEAVRWGVQNGVGQWGEIGNKKGGFPVLTRGDEDIIIRGVQDKPDPTLMEAENAHETLHYSQNASAGAFDSPDCGHRSEAGMGADDGIPATRW